VIVNVVSGSVYLWGNISLYVVSYFQMIGGNEDLTTEKASIILTLQLIVKSVIAPAGAVMQKKYSPKLILMIGSSLIAGSYYVSSYTTNWNIFVFVYGILFPAGVGLSCLPTIINAWEYYPNNKGLVAGIIIGAFGFGSFITG
jgi:cyanate permease